MEDPRHLSYITYTQSDLVNLGILKNICAVDSMRQMNEKFNEDVCIDTLSFMAGNTGLEELPDYGTLNYYLEQLSPACLSELRRKMVVELIRSKVFNQNRLLGKYWIVIFDGTGLFHFKERHCENCLVQTTVDERGNRRQEYYHKVLEAKLVLADNLVVSLGTEFIENEKEDPKEIEINTNEKAVEEQEEDSDKLLEEKLVMKYSKEDIINVPDEFEGIRCPEAERYTYDPYLESNIINRFFFRARFSASKARYLQIPAELNTHSEIS